MTEVPPSLPAVSARKRFAPLLWLCGGLALGLLLAFTILSAGRGAPEEDNEVFRPHQAPSTPLPSRGDDPSSDQSEEAGKFGVKPGASRTVDPSGLAPPVAGSTGPTTPGSSAPAATSTSVPESLTGALPTGPMPSPVGPLKPIVIEEHQVPGVAQASYFEFLEIVAETEFEASVRRIRSVAAANKAQISVEFHHEPERPEVGLDLFLSVPKVAAGKLRDELSNNGSAQETEHWTGPYSERHARVERDYRERARQLEGKLKQLLVKYLDDAPEVIRTQESLDRVKKALAGLRPAGPEREVIRVFVGKAPPGIHPR